MWPARDQRVRRFCYCCFCRRSSCCFLSHSRSAVIRPTQLNRGLDAFIFTSRHRFSHPRCCLSSILFPRDLAIRKKRVKKEENIYVDVTNAIRRRAISIDQRHYAKAMIARNKTFDRIRSRVMRCIGSVLRSTVA